MQVTYRTKNNNHPFVEAERTLTLSLPLFTNGGLFDGMVSSVLESLQG